jgi:hypothetical protein
VFFRRISLTGRFHEICELGIPCDERGDIRTARNNLPAAFSCFLQRGADQTGTRLRGTTVCFAQSHKRARPRASPEAATLPKIIPAIGWLSSE